jgi:hypothetical protein
MLNAIDKTTTTTISTTVNERGFMRAAYGAEAERQMNEPFRLRSALNAL